MEPLLRVALGQPPLLAALAARYLRILVPSLWALGLCQAFQAYLQAQSVTRCDAALVVVQTGGCRAPRVAVAKRRLLSSGEGSQSLRNTRARAMWAASIERTCDKPRYGDDDRSGCGSWSRTGAGAGGEGGVRSRRDARSVGG